MNNALRHLTVSLFCLVPLLAQGASWPSHYPPEQRVLPREGQVIDHRTQDPAAGREKRGVSFMSQGMDGAVHIWDARSWAQDNPAPAQRIEVSVSGAGPTFEITYQDVDQNTGFGFDHPQRGATRRNTVQQVMQDLSDLLAGNSNGTIEVEFLVSEQDGSGQLGQGGPLWLCQPGFVYGFPRNHAVTGVDPDDVTGQELPDMQIQIDFGHNLNDGLDSPNNTEFDLATLVLHELTHGLGFVSGGINTGNGQVLSCGGAQTALFFNSYLHDGTGNRLWLDTNGVSFQGSPADVGPSATVEYRGTPSTSPVPVFTGDLSHWTDAAAIGGARPVMLTAQFNGETRRTYQFWERDVLTDLGYTLADSVFQINAGLNDAWFNPATSGQGFFINVFPGLESIFLGWFTYDINRPPSSATAELGEPGHRWLTAFGGWQGDTATLDVTLTTGGRFDNPTSAQNSDPGTYGTVTIQFHDCNAATLTYNLFAVGETGEIPIRRLTTDNVALCEALALQTD